jgi:propane monooxygenase reductase subunit
MKVRFEPLGEEIECAPEETVLDAAFRQGYNLAYGCREGQCSACKCFLMEGDVALKPYSNFALSESEQANGYSLMCRAMPEQHLVVELLHYDPENYRLENPIGDGSAVVEVVESLTHDITRLVLRSDEFSFLPGQYVDLWVPGVEGAKRSFSLANLPGDGRLEFMIKRYPGGKLSGMLSGEIKVGDVIQFTGPYGAFHLRRSERPILMIAGGSGMAPVLGVLRQLASEGCSRPIRFFYGARTSEDLFYLDEIGALASSLPDFEFVPVVERFVHEAVDEFLAAGSFGAPDVYMCGPPPMLEAAEPMLIDKHKLDEQRIFQVHDRCRGRSRPRGGVERGSGAARQAGRYRAAVRRRCRATVLLVHAFEAPRDAVRRRHGRYAAVYPPPPDPRLARQLRGWPRHLG